MVTFVYNTTTLTLRNPIIGNKKRLDFRQTIKRSMSGKFWTYRNYQPIIVLELEFEHENRPTMLLVIDFLRLSAGQLITYTDHHSVAYTGKIITAPFDETHLGRVNNVFALQFELTTAPP